MELIHLTLLFLLLVWTLEIPYTKWNWSCPVFHSSFTPWFTFLAIWSQIKLTISGKSSIREEDFDETTSDSLCKDYDISSISGSEDEEERENGLVVDIGSGNSGVLKSKIFMQLQTGERVSVWRCLVLIESENISFENDQKLDTNGDGGVLHWSGKQVIEKLKYIVHEPRDNTSLRIVLLARGGHFAGCVFDGNSLVAHKTFHRLVPSHHIVCFRTCTIFYLLSC